MVRAKNGGAHSPVNSNGLFPKMAVHSKTMDNMKRI